EYFMKQALEQAKIALEKGEIPVGAVITFDNKIIARTHNQTELLNDFTAHAEMLAFTSASEHFSNKYLDKCTLYVTLEPCVMCAGAALWTRINHICYGASDPKKGFLQLRQPILHPKTQITGGVLQEECTQLPQEFFNKKRGDH